MKLTYLITRFILILTLFSSKFMKIILKILSLIFSNKRTFLFFKRKYSIIQKTILTITVKNPIHRKTKVKWLI